MERGRQREGGERGGDRSRGREGGWEKREVTGEGWRKRDNERDRDRERGREERLGWGWCGWRGKISPTILIKTDSFWW